ncbi:MAG: M20/M25/M40 family metallo-hydrolase [Deltaproteobacteria bacterium]|nr:M20/M25/M40 family metallo-hydrolase [Deltaproteobacteria bacterium]MBI3389926.1 M20/M25/M40 family metallo-hydrolase [Deltaproteobacteria bacterium]
MRTTPIAVALFTVFSLSAYASELPLSPQQKRVRDIYQELIEIDTTHSTGSTTTAAKTVAKRLRAAGFAAKDVQILGPKPNRGNLVARLHGSDAKRPLLLLAHLDVVEAKRSDWSVDPFKLLEQDGFFYARGSLDDKAMAAIFVEIMLRMKQAGGKPDRDVILVLTADEEGGPDNGVDWLLKNHRDLVDAEMVLNEGGGGRMRSGTYLLNGVQASEKTYTNFLLEVKNKGGHSSLPTKDNAIYRLAAGLGRLEKFEFPVELNDVTRAYFERSAKTESGQTTTDMLALLQDPPDTQAIARLSETPSYNALMRTTCVATRLEGGHADNALPQTARANINCRVLPGHSMDEVRQTLIGVLADDQIGITETEPASAGPASPVDPALIAVVERITESMWPGVPVIPTMSTGASDSRYFRSAGINAYGVSGIFVDMDDVRAHGKDERVGVKQFYEGQEFLSRLVTALTTAP